MPPSVVLHGIQLDDDEIALKFQPVKVSTLQADDTLKVSCQGYHLAE